jgi:DNA-binding HxlR family transcriptional regulator
MQQYFCQVRTIFAGSIKKDTRKVISMRKPRHRNDATCPVEAALSRIGGKWKGLIVFRLLERTWRFNELKRSLPGCTQRMLTNQLRDLEEDGIVHREIFPQVPPRVEYSLTDIGRDLEPMVRAMCDWGQRHVEGVDTKFVFTPEDTKKS